MAKVVLTTKLNSIYDDLPEVRYHFPRTYLKAVEAARGDWAVYYEPLKDKGRQAYFATARIVDVQPDRSRDGLFYAFVSDYLEFDHAVPVRHSTGFYESALEGGEGKINAGSVQRAVRRLPDAEFELILRVGFTAVVGEQIVGVPLGHAANEEPAAFQRPIIQQVVNRPFRDVAFKEAVRSAYRQTCAMTGLRMINGGGRPEAEAAHIRPVQDAGPDSVRNGLALSGTVHWMFDRGLVSVADDYTILRVERGIPDQMLQLLNANRRLIVPESPALRPHPQFLKYHRENVFKG